MPVLAAARFIGITDKRLWRIVEHYVGRAVAGLDLSGVHAVGLDETASKRGHNYVTVFIDMDRRDKPVIFVTPGKGKACVAAFRAFMLSHRGEPTAVAEVVCDMSPAFLAALAQGFPNAAVTIDWFHVVQLFTTAVDQVRKAEARGRKLALGQPLGRAQGRRAHPRPSIGASPWPNSRRAGSLPPPPIAAQGDAPLDPPSRRPASGPLAQHNVSRLLRRLELLGVIERRPCAEDGRGQIVAVAETGRDLLRRMWPVYRAAIQRHVGAKLKTDMEAKMLGRLLGCLIGVDEGS